MDKKKMSMPVFYHTEWKQMREKDLQEELIVK